MTASKSLYRARVEIEIRKPRIPVTILDMSKSDHGICQSECNETLKIRQANLSKLVRKMVTAGLLKVVKGQGDSRQRLTITTDKGRELLDPLDQKLDKLAPSESRSVALGKKRRLHPQKGQPGFFTELA